MSVARKNIVLRTHLDVNDALQFHLLDLVMSPAFFPPFFPLWCQFCMSAALHRKLWTDTPPLPYYISFTISLYFSLYRSLGLYLTLPQSRAFLFPHPHRLSQISKRPLASSQKPSRSSNVCFLNSVSHLTHDRHRVTYMHATTMQKGGKRVSTTSCNLRCFVKCSESKFAT